MDIMDSHGRALQRRWLYEWASGDERAAVAWSTEPYRWLRPDEEREHHFVQEVGDAPSVLISDYLRRHGADVPARARYTPEAARRIASIRTDADAFSGYEVAFLVNHGYLECAAALEGSAARLSISGMRPKVPLAPPFDWYPPGHEGITELVLADSGRTSRLGRPYEMRAIRRSLAERLPRRRKSAPATVEAQIQDFEDIVLIQLGGGIMSDDEARRRYQRVRRKLGEDVIPNFD
jgi:hypothetical protein